MTQTKLRTEIITANDNITFPVGTAFAVRQCFSKLHLYDVFAKHKKRGRCLASLIEALVTYRLTENQSISCASNWINRPQVLKEFRLDGSFNEKTLFRALTLVGENKEHIMSDVQDEIFRKYDLEHTDVNMDWTSIVLHGEKCPLGKYGYSRDHRPDKKQITLGLTELASPINIPIGMTIMPGNTNDQSHFRKTFSQVRRLLREDSLVVYDKGGNSKENNNDVLRSRMKFLTSKKLNLSDDKRIKKFRKSDAECIDPKKGIYGVKFRFPTRTDYFFFSETLKQEQLQSSIRKAVRKFEEAKLLQDCLDNGRNLPAKFRIHNELVEMQYSYQTKLKELGPDALAYVKKHTITGREGFFCLVSSEDLTLREALEIYRKKDSIEKLINSLKNEIEIKPLRVWIDESIYGALLIGFIAQLVISMIRFEHAELKNTSAKFIKISLMNLTVTLEIMKNKVLRRIYANFDAINSLILTESPPIS
jgi:transposase